ncbi:MAG: DEAD/DEAH box helicase family protein [Rhodococcus sp.]|nr:DEAD/DEAH box helicase family protein [Rhodococcus sp. (in: high G+C Gram-positive bacteria)]
MSVFLEIDQVEWIASNELAFAIRDRFPVSPGHSLVIPRRVVTHWWEASLEEQQAILELVDRVKLRLDAESAPDGYNVGFNAGTAAGQTVPHLHVHVIPRFDGDMSDPRGGVRHVIPARVNYLTPAAAAPAPPALVTPLDGRMRVELVRCLIREDYDRIDLLVSFVMRSGISLIAQRVDEALARGAHIRLLTTDYLQITDTAALGFFLDRLSDGPVGRLEARVFSDPTTSFHPKAYIFSSSASGEGVAFVGSSNLSHSGISTGVEWNIQTFGTGTLVEEFDRLWTDERSIALTADWLADYDVLRQQRHLTSPIDETHDEIDAEAAAAVEGVDNPRPWTVQAEAMTALEATRLDGHQAGLAVMATGLGKTWLAAFDSTRPEFRRVLFVAHREEILTQARDVYRQIRPGGRLTLFTGQERDPDGDVVFASVQSLHRNLSAFDPEAFDYVVVDEFHHAAADTYRRVIAHFRPKFLLGLTATANRADNADLLALCSDNLVYDCGLVEGIRRELLSPFRYRAIPDVADYEHIPWRNGRFDLEALTSHIATRERAQQVFEEWQAIGAVDRRTIGFCCTIAHAEFMADYFRDRGVRAVAVHSGASSSPRAESLEQLAAGNLPVVFAVDLFNEGVDVPSIDLVMMLRPTESSVVFLQQLGRGLRRSDGKSHLEVVDLVGNHRGFLLKARLLAKLAGFGSLTDREALTVLADHRDDLTAGSDLPDGCSIVVAPEVVDMLRELLGPIRSQDRLVELVREWIDEHDGRRPTALEMAVETGQAFQLKSRGGWFGFLAELGLLDTHERRVLEQAREFLVWIEHGNYTKSYKLITLLALDQLNGLLTGAPTSDVAATARWMIFRDNDLLADLADASASFADLQRPTTAEWESYWRRNPIRAITTASRGQEPWFDEIDGRLTPRLALDESLTGAFETMVREITEYRLHRYLAAQAARRVGEVRQPTEGGVDVDATFSVETTGTVPTSVVIMAAGGTKGTEDARNTEYVRGFDLVLQRLAGIGAQLVDAYVDSQRTAGLTVADRRLDLGDGVTYPVPLAAGTDLEAARKSMLRSMMQVGRGPASKGGGNARKRMRLIIHVPPQWSAAALADALAHGLRTSPSTELEASSSAEPTR